MALIRPNNDIRNVTYPQLVGAGGNKVPDEIGICGKPVRGVRRAGLAYLLPHLQVMPVDNIGEPVAPDRLVLLKIAPVHVPEFGASDSRILRTNAPDVFQGEGFSGRPGQNLRLVAFVICLLRYAKQPAKKLSLS